MASSTETLDAWHKAIEGIWEQINEVRHVVDYLQADLENDLDRVIRSNMPDDDISLRFPKSALERRTWANGKVLVATRDLEQKTRDLMNEVAGAAFDAERNAMKAGGRNG